MRWILLLGLVGCGEKEDDTGETGEDSGASCGSTQGFVSGTISFEGSAAAKSSVIAENADGVQVTTLTDTAGAFELNLDEGDWVVFAQHFLSLIHI